MSLSKTVIAALLFSTCLMGCNHWPLWVIPLDRPRPQKTPGIKLFPGYFNFQRNYLIDEGEGTATIQSESKVWYPAHTELVYQPNSAAGSLPATIFYDLIIDPIGAVVVGVPALAVLPFNLIGAIKMQPRYLPFAMMLGALPGITTSNSDTWDARIPLRHAQLEKRLEALARRVLDDYYAAHPEEPRTQSHQKITGNVGTKMPLREALKVTETAGLFYPLEGSD